MFKSASTAARITLPVATLALRSSGTAPNTDTFSLTDILTSITWTPSQLNNDQIRVKVIDNGPYGTQGDFVEYLYGINIAVTYDDVAPPQNVVPEVPFGTIAILSALAVGMVVYAKRGKLPNLRTY